jgi:uncharacterized protein (DUF488 family)
VANPDIYSVGHSNQSLKQFLQLIKGAGIDRLVDVRSQPSSKYSPHFSLASIRRAAVEAGIAFEYGGAALGGRPTGPEFYDAAGHVDYAALSRAPFFEQGIDALIDSAKSGRIAVMCSEEDPAGCHRRLLIGRVLAGRDVTMLHLRGTGKIETETSFGRSPQLGLFGEVEDQAWKSIRSVLPGGPPQPSLAH